MFFPFPGLIFSVMVDFFPQDCHERVGLHNIVMFGDVKCCVWLLCNRNRCNSSE